jgi:hypothetical protein
MMYLFFFFFHIVFADEALFPQIRLGQGLHDGICPESAGEQ